MAIIKRDYQPAYINDFSSSLLDGFYLQEGETLNDAIARAAEAFSFGDEGLAQRIYEAVHDGWFMFSSPILANAPSGSWTREPSREDWENHTTLQHFDGEKARALPISCYSLAIGDTIDAQLEAMVELAALSVSGGGVGLHNRIRATSPKAPGPIPFEKVLDAEIGYYKQSSTRRGATAYYMDVDHPDIIEHIKFRLPTGGDRKRRSDNITQFHSAVNVTDEFIEAVIGDKDFDLRCPHTGQVHETVKARKIWETLLETRALTGEPYIFKIDTANRALPQAQKDLGLTVKGGNLCVSGDTMLLTEEFGNRRIDSLVGEDVHVWNGKQWSQVTPFQTSESSELLIVTLSDGREIRATPYHKFYLQDGYKPTPIEVEAKDLDVGDRLVRNEVQPIEGTFGYDKFWYWSGFYTGDGTQVRNRNRLYFYNDKLDLCEKFEAEFKAVPTGDRERNIAKYNKLQYEGDFGFTKFAVPAPDASPSEKLSFLAGLADSDGTISRNGSNESLQICSVRKDFLLEVQSMLLELGIDSSVTMMGGPVARSLPNGKGGYSDYECQASYRLIVSSLNLYHLARMGFQTHRLSFEIREPQRSARPFPTVVSIDYLDEEEATFCVNEPLEHKVVLNGILTGNCNEITLTTDEERTFVCCLSSLNLLKFDEWKDSTVVADLTRFLDNVIQYFIEMAGEVKGMSKAVYSAMRERALGIGAMGWHHYLQSKGIPFESGGVNSAISHTHVIFKNIKGNATLESQRLAYERGEAPDMEGTGRRNSHLLAVAPNSNSGIILGVSPSIEPEAGVAYVHKTRAGSHIVKNPHFEKILNAYSDDAAWRDKQWQQILAENGSIQNLDWCTEEQKNLFRTAYEIDQHWIVEQADARQQHLCQSQSLNLFFPFGVSKEYYNSVHLKAIKAEYVKGLYYSRMRRSQDMSAIHRLEKRTLKDWSGDTDESACIACEG